jgi:hypothetical protein
VFSVSIRAINPVTAIVLKLEAVRISETLAYFYESTWCSISESCHLQSGNTCDQYEKDTKDIVFPVMMNNTFKAYARIEDMTHS